MSEIYLTYSVLKQPGHNSLSYIVILKEVAASLTSSFRSLGKRSNVSKCRLSHFPASFKLSAGKWRPLGLISVDMHAAEQGRRAGNLELGVSPMNHDPARYTNGVGPQVSGCSSRSLTDELFSQTPWSVFERQI